MKISPARIFGFSVCTLLMVSGCQGKMLEGKPQISETTGTVSAPSVQPEANQEKKLLLVGDTIFLEQEGKKTPLFVNIQGVSAVRFGPDGSSVHFLRSERSTPGCANLAAPLSQDEQNPALTKASWDYQNIASAGGLSGCDDSGQESGFLRTEPFFVYIERRKNQAAELIVESLQEIQLVRATIPEDFTKEYMRDSFNWTHPVTTGSTTYFFPNEGFYFKAKKRLLLNFQNALLLIDLEKQKVLSVEAAQDPKHHIVGSGYTFLSAEESPLVLVKVGWEGEELIKLLDVSRDKLGSFSIDNIELPLPGYFNPNLNIYEWQGENLLLHEYKRALSDVLQILSKEEISHITGAVSFPSNDKAEIASFLHKAEEKIKKEGAYAAVKCRFPGNYDGGCAAFSKGKDYILKPGGKLKQL